MNCVVVCLTAQARWSVPARRVVIVL